MELCYISSPFCVKFILLEALSQATARVAATVWEKRDFTTKIPLLHLHRYVGDMVDALDNAVAIVYSHKINAQPIGKFGMKRRIQICCTGKRG